MISYYAAILILLFLVRPALSAEFHRLDVRAAVSYALKNVPALKSFSSQKEIAALNLRSEKFALFPKLQLSASTGISAELTNDARWTNGLSLGLSQPLLSKSTNTIAIDIASTKDRIAELELLNQRDLLCVKVAKDFYQHAAAFHQLTISRQRLDALKRQLNIVDQRFQQGLKTQRDVVRFQAQVRQAEIQDAAAHNRVLQTKLALIASMTGDSQQSLADTFEFDTPLPRYEMSALPINEPSILLHPIYRKFEEEKKLATLEIDLSKRALWPELAANVGASFNTNPALRGSFVDTSHTMFSVGLSFNFELFDFGKRRRDILVASKNQQIRENDIKTKLATETLALANVMNTIALQKESVRLNTQLLAIQEDNLKRIESDYLSGKAQYYDIITALNDLADAKKSLYSALFDLEAQMIMHRYYEGTVYDSLS